MADEPSTLTKELKAKVIKWLNEKTPNLKCPSCGGSNFHIGDHFVTPTIYRPDGGLVVGGTSYPHFMVHCTHCLHLMQFSAIASGVLPPKTPEKAAEEEKEDKGV